VLGIFVDNMARMTDGMHNSSHIVIALLMPMRISVSRISWVFVINDVMSSILVSIFVLVSVTGLYSPMQVNSSNSGVAGSYPHAIMRAIRRDDWSKDDIMTCVICVVKYLIEI